MLRVPKRGCTPPSMKSWPSSPPMRWAVLARPSGPAAKERWSRRMWSILRLRRVRPRQRGRCLLTSRSVASGTSAVSAGRPGAGPAAERERRCASQCRDQLVVRRRAHQLGQLGLVGDVDRLDGDVGLGVAGAVPVEVVAARAPAAPVVLADRHLGVGRAVLPLDVAEGAPDRQLPAHVGLGLERVASRAEAPARAGRSPRRRAKSGRLWKTQACCPSTSRVRVLRSPSSSVSIQSFLRTASPAGGAATARASSWATYAATRFSSALSAKWAPRVQQPASGASA